jgi:soluble lytic murein transglycosylase
VTNVEDGMRRPATDSSPIRRLALASTAGLTLAALLAAPLTGNANARSDDDEPTLSQELITANNGRSKPRNNSAAVRAIDAALDGKWQAAFDGASRTGDQAAMKTVEWLYIRKNPKDAGSERIMNFVAANPSWPASRALTRAAEARLADRDTPIETVARHFNRFTPISAWGHVAFARLALARGDRSSAAAAVRKAWLDDDLSTSLEKEILRNYGALLGRDDHKARMYAMIMAQETNAAVRAAGMVSRQHVQAAKAAQALIRRKSNGPALYKKLPAEFRNHPPMLYAYARYFRRKGDYATAFNLLKRGPASHAAQIRPDQWFVEKRLAARHLAASKYRKHWPAIYKMMASHGFKSGKHYIEAEFLAGWFALRKLSEPGAAAVHFKRITEAATTRTDASRGWYWLGRARAAKGEGGRAEQAYKQAAASPTLFYGQLALDKLGFGKRPLNISAASASSAGLAKAKQVEVFRAAHLLAQAGGDREVGLFLFPIARAIKSPAEAASAIDAIHSQEGYFAAVRLAKAFGAMGVDVDNWAYPVNALPNWRSIGPRVEKSVILGLSRQESEFNATAGSHAGAKGFMQIMPGTGKGIARQYRISGYRTSDLTQKPALNVAMGEAYLGGLIDRFGGSYILAFAGYNAGPGNAQKWIDIYGDPRSPGVDAIDWIESIPITETRKYVQKVMQNVHVYRTRLDQKKYAISYDINRGGRKAASGGSGCGDGARTIASLLNDC